MNTFKKNTARFLLAAATVCAACATGARAEEVSEHAPAAMAGGQAAAAKVSGLERRHTETIWRLTDAEFARGDGPTAPSQGWTPVRLPDVFSTQPLMGDHTGWFRLAFDMAAPPPEPLVLLVPRVVLTAEFRLNGSLLNPGVRFEQPGGPAGTQMMSRPVWITLPTGLFHAGRNELLIRLRGNRVTPAWIGEISIGSPDALRGEFLLRDIPQRVVPQIQFVILMTSLIFGVRLWWRNRQPLQTSLLVTSVLWLLYLGLYLEPDLPVPWRTSIALISVLWIAFHWALLNLLWRMSGGDWPWFPRVLAIGSILPLVGAVLVLAFEPTSSMLGLLMLPTTILRCMTTVMMVRWAWRTRKRASVWLAGTELLWSAGLVQLLLVVMKVLPHDPFMLAPACSLPMYLVMLWQGAQRLVKEREDATLKQQLVVIEERERLMLEMHDGIGSQLVTALRMARREEIPRHDLAQLIQDALEDLRLIIEAQDGAAQDLTSLLQAWRQRNESRMAAVGTRLRWSLAPLAQPRRLSPHEALQVLRILQEALNNAVQHSGSSSITIALKAAPGGCELCVSDDGVGLMARESRLQLGRGLQSMKRRAERLGAVLDVRPVEPHGTVVSLVLPDVAPA